MLLFLGSVDNGELRRVFAQLLLVLLGGGEAELFLGAVRQVEPGDGPAYDTDSDTETGSGREALVSSARGCEFSAA